MSTANLPSALPPVSPLTSGETLLAANLANEQDTDRNELRALAAMIGLGASTPARGKVRIGTGTGTSAFDRFARQNLLINGDARVNMRASTATADGSYGPDMWQLLIEAANAATLTKVAGGLPASNASPSGFLLVVGSANNNKFGLWSPIRAESSGQTRGGVVSLQLKALASDARIGDVRAAAIQFIGTADNGGAAWPDPISAWGAAGTNPTLGTNWSFCSTPVNLNVPNAWPADPITIQAIPVGSTTKNLGVLIWCDDKTTNVGDFLVVTDVQLEEGSYCTEVERTKIEDVEDACASYYQKSVNAATAPLTSAIGNAWPVYVGTVAASALHSKIVFPRRMYGTPTVRIWPYATGTNTSRVSDSSGNDLAAGSGTPYVVNEAGFGVQNNSGGTITTPSNLVNFNWDAVAPW